MVSSAGISHRDREAGHGPIGRAARGERVGRLGATDGASGVGGWTRPRRSDSPQRSTGFRRVGDSSDEAREIARNPAADQLPSRGGGRGVGQRGVGPRGGLRRGWAAAWLTFSVLSLLACQQPGSANPNGTDPAGSSSERSPTESSPSSGPDVSSRVDRAVNRYAKARRNREVPDVMWEDPDSDSADANRRPGAEPPASASSQANRSSAPRSDTTVPEEPIIVRRPSEPASVSAGESEASSSPASGAAAVNGERAAGPASSATRLRRLLDRVDEREQPAVAGAVRQAALTVIDPSMEIDATLLSRLDPAERKRVRQYQRLVRLLAERVLAESNQEAATDDDSTPKDKTFDRLLAELEGGPDEARGGESIEILNVELCRRVRGFGVYDPFESHAFVAGQEQPMIVYVELDHFRTQKLSESQYEVRLEQELVLYNKSDGLAVWREKPVEIVDRSKNIRRDFFTVQLIRLPTRLTVGAFTLKVRVTDKQSRTLDEHNVPIRIVADKNLTRNP